MLKRGLVTTLGFAVGLAVVGAVTLTDNSPSVSLPDSGPKVPDAVCGLMPLSEAKSRAKFAMYLPDHPLTLESKAQTDLCDNSSFTRFASGVGLIVEPADPPDASKLLSDISREDPQYKTTTIRGVPALYVAPSDRTNGGFIWYEDGLYFSVSGNKTISLEILRAIAQSIKRA